MISYSLGFWKGLADLSQIYTQLNECSLSSGHLTRFPFPLSYPYEWSSINSINCTKASGVAQAFGFLSNLESGAMLIRSEIRLGLTSQVYAVSNKDHRTQRREMGPRVFMAGKTRLFIILGNWRRVERCFVILYATPKFLSVEPSTQLISLVCAAAPSITKNKARALGSQHQTLGQAPWFRLQVALSWDLFVCIHLQPRPHMLCLSSKSTLPLWSLLVSFKELSHVKKMPGPNKA